MAQGMISKPADCLDCGTALELPRNPRTVRCPSCQATKSKEVARKANKEWYERKKATDPGYIRKQYDRHNAYRRRMLREDEEWAEAQRASSRKSRARAMRDPGKRKQRKEYQRKWTRENRERINAQRRAQFRQWRLDALEEYGGKCACCGEESEPFLCIDHENGGGNQHRKEIAGIGRGGGYRTYKWLKDNGYPPGFRVLCHNCNMAIGFYGYCPHQKT